MHGITINSFEESPIKNKRLPIEWQDQNSLDELEEFLQSNWEQRSVFYDDGEVTSRQQYLGFTGQKGLRTNNYIGTVVFKDSNLIFSRRSLGKKKMTMTQKIFLSHI